MAATLTVATTVRNILQLRNTVEARIVRIFRVRSANLYLIVVNAIQ